MIPTFSLPAISSSPSLFGPAGFLDDFCSKNHYKSLSSVSSFFAVTSWSVKMPEQRETCIQSPVYWYIYRLILIHSDTKCIQVYLLLFPQIKISSSFPRSNLITKVQQYMGIAIEQFWEWTEVPRSGRPLPSCLNSVLRQIAWLSQQRQGGKILDRERHIYSIPKLFPENSQFFANICPAIYNRRAPSVFAKLLTYFPNPLLLLTAAPIYAMDDDSFFILYSQCYSRSSLVLARVLSHFCLFSSLPWVCVQLVCGTLVKEWLFHHYDDGQLLVLAGVTKFLE